MTPGGLVERDRLSHGGRAGATPNTHPLFAFGGRSRPESVPALAEYSSSFELLEEVGADNQLTAFNRVARLPQREPGVVPTGLHPALTEERQPPRTVLPDDSLDPVVPDSRSRRAGPTDPQRVRPECKTRGHVPILRSESALRSRRRTVRGGAGSPGEDRHRCERLTRGRPRPDSRLAAAVRTATAVPSRSRSLVAPV